MISLPIRSPAGDVTAVHAYDVAVTDTLKSYPTLNFSFIADDKNETSEKMIAPRAIVTDPTTGQQYRIATSNPVPSGNYRIYAVTTIHIAHDLHDLYLEDTITGSQSLKACCDFLTANSKFKYSIDGTVSDHDFGSNTLGKAHGDDVLSAIADAFNIEFWFDNTTIHLASKIGKDNSFVFVDKVNASKIQVNEDYTTIETAIKGVGKEIEQNNTSGTDDIGGSGIVAAFARQFAGRPYVWGGNQPSGWDCSGFVAYIYNHFGIPMHQPTTYEEYQGQVVGPPYQEGDMLFWGARGATYHVALALDSNTLIMAANPDRGTVIQAISAWPPAFGVRNPQMAAKVQAQDSSDDSSDTDTTDQQPQYTCQAEYLSPMADDNKWGKIWADDFSSDTITDEDTLKQALKAQLHDYPDVEYTMDWVNFKDNSGINSDIAVGNHGWLRDRYGIDVNVRVQSYTKYIDPTTTQTDTITFGNKIFGPDEWNNRNNAAKSALSQPAKNNPVTADDILTITGEEVDKIEQYVNGQASNKSDEQKKTNH